MQYSPSSSPSEDDDVDMHTVLMLLLFESLAPLTVTGHPAELGVLAALVGEHDLDVDDRMDEEEDVLVDAQVDWLASRSWLATEPLLDDSAFRKLTTEPLLEGAALPLLVQEPLLDISVVSALMEEPRLDDECFSESTTELPPESTTEPRLDNGCFSESAMEPRLDKAGGTAGTGLPTKASPDPSPAAMPGLKWNSSTSSSVSA